MNNVNCSFTPRSVNEVDLVGKLVGVHWNAHKACWSIVSFKSRKTVGTVAGYASEITLEDISFKVDLSKKEKALCKGKKDRHTFIVGTYISSTVTYKENPDSRLKYDVTSNTEPFKHLDGTTATGKTVVLTKNAKVFTV